MEKNQKMSILAKPMLSIKPEIFQSDSYQENKEATRKLSDRV